ncbi:hypothetical protein BACCIP111899_01593 [Bacillus rhizoplanae]|uniref:DUF4263 domain-containing protein n=1 Tax=Bacillus rhizoplanae TaxID=2880966 RepID=A0ABN7ZUS8_9BACI|nr:hypothetical protein [Bacillus rhizoplanae]CAG9612417.1 hypothetical protein BACCIP111899_01593 [Bacillus rhizoplanae]
MESIEQNLIHGLMREFSVNFVRKVNDLKKVLQPFNGDVAKALPPAFQSSGAIIEVAFSHDKRDVLIMFKKSDDIQINSKIITGSVSQLIGNIIGVSGEGEVYMQNCMVNDRKIEQAFLFSYSVFRHKLLNVQQFARDFVRVHWDYYKTQGKNQFKPHLEALKFQMECYFFDETVPELTIDKFLEENPIILECGLNLYKPRSQVIMKDILKKYNQDLKPDLIAFNEREKIWTIVDYKRAKENIIKNVGKVRSSFKSEVHDLEAQLRDYREYFYEREQREYICKKYKMDIQQPNTIGVIGNIKEDEQDAFNRLIADKPRWFNIVPYNYLYDSFCRYLDLTIKLIKD